MKFIKLLLLFLIGFSYQSKAQQESTKLFTVDYYPVPEFFDQIIIKSYAMGPIHKYLDWSIDHFL